MKKQLLSTCLLALIALLGIAPPALAADRQCGNNIPELWDYSQGWADPISRSNGNETFAPSFKCYKINNPPEKNLVITIETRSQTTLNLYHSTGRVTSFSDTIQENQENTLSGGPFIYLYVESGWHTFGVESSGARDFRISASSTQKPSGPSSDVAMFSMVGNEWHFLGQNSSRPIDRLTFPFELQRPGIVEISVENGPTTNLGLMLIKPDGSRYTPSTQNSLNLRYEITPSDYSRGNKWRVVLSNVSRDWPLKVIIKYPSSATGVSPSTSTFSTCGGSIGNQQRISSAISASGNDCRYTFNGTAGDQVVIRMTALNDQLDPFLELRDPNGNRIAYDDDSGGRPNSLINRTLPVGGTFTIVAGSFNGKGAGSFELSFNQQTSSPQVNSPLSTQSTGICPDPNASWENIADGQTLNVYHTFTGTAYTDNFLGYLVEYIRPGNILYRSTTPVVHGDIFFWNTTTVPNGDYWLALTVYRRDETISGQCVIRVRVAH